MKKLPLDSDDPKGTAHLQLTPLAGTALARKFATIDLWVDPKTSMPIRITVLDADKNIAKQTDLTDVNVTAPPKDSDFDMEKIDLNGWELHDEGALQ